jgi:hypothetical protein
MEAIFTKNKSKIILIFGVLFIVRSIYKMLHGNVTFYDASPAGFDKDYITSVWVSKVIFLVLGIIICFIFLINRKNK